MRTSQPQNHLHPLQMASAAASMAMSLAQLPPLLLSSAVSTAVLILIAICGWFVYTVGYPRLFSTHHSMDLPGYIRFTSRRLAKRLMEISSAVIKFEKDELVSALAKSLPIRDVPAVLKDMKDDERELTECIAESITGSNARCHAYSTLLKVSQANVQIAAIIAPFRRAIQNHEVPREVQLAACAVADIRLVMSTAVPNIGTMHNERTRSMDLPQTVMYHIRPDLQLYLERLKEATKSVTYGRRDAQQGAQAVVGRLDNLAMRLMTGETQEPFFQKLINLFLKPFKITFSLIDAIFSLVMSSMKMLGDVFQDALALVRMTFIGLGRIARELKKGPVQGCVALLSVLLGFVLKVIVAVGRSTLLMVFYWILVLWYPLLVCAWLTLVFALIMACKIAIALVDFATLGSIRFISRTDQHPEAWWVIAGHERGNLHRRNIVSWRPCSPGYVVSPSSMFCERVESGIPNRSPVALLARKYLLGRFGEWGRKVPARDPVSQQVFAKLKQREYASVFAGSDGKCIRDLVDCIVLCQRDILGGGALVSELAFHVGHDVSQYAFIDEPIRTSAGVRFVVGSITFACAALTTHYVMQRYGLVPKHS